MKFLLFAIFMALFISPVFAVGNLNVATTSIAPAYINTRTITNMLNITMNSTDGNTNITSLNVTIAGNATIGNVSGVFLINSTGSAIASSTANSTATKFTVSIPAGFNASSGANTSMIVALNLSRSSVETNISVQLVSSAEFGVDSGSNVTFGVVVNSTEPKIQDIHANASIYPNFIDTNTINQTLVYVIVPTGRDAIKNVTITIPSGYSFTNVSTVETTVSNGSSLSSYTTAPNYINVTINTPTTQVIKVTFNVNTSTTRVNSAAFTSTIDGGNRTGIATDPPTVGSTNVTTQQLINVTNVAIARGAAIVNGTDYWEFNFTLNFTANLTGLIQFKMSNWTDASSPPNNIHINTSSAYYATLRNNTNFSDNNGKFNVTNIYVENTGLSQTVTDFQTPLALILRMVIPAGSAISSTWAATYNFLFRAIS